MKKVLFALSMVITLGLTAQEAPKVTSAMVYVHFDKPALACSDKMLKTVVRTAFNQRRKKLSNALKSMIQEVDCSHFDLNVRAEEWTPDIYAEFATYLEAQFPE